MRRDLATCRIFDAWLDELEKRSWEDSEHQSGMIDQILDHPLHSELDPELDKSFVLPLSRLDESRLDLGTDGVSPWWPGRLYIGDLSQRHHRRRFVEWIIASLPDSEFKVLQECSDETRDPCIVRLLFEIYWCYLMEADDWDLPIEEPYWLDIEWREIHNRPHEGSGLK